MATVVGRTPARAGARRAGEVLRWALTASDGDRDTGPSPSAAALDDLTDRAEYHRITPLLHAVADRIPDLEPEVAAGLESSYHYAVRRHLFVLDDLAWVGATLAELAPEVLVIKGPVLSATAYRRADLRSYGDLDVVVPAGAFARAVELLLDAGATFLVEDWSAACTRRLGELALALPSGTVLDLHWHLVALGSLRDRFRVPVAAVVARARPVVIDGATYRTLGLADTVVHQALHAVLCGGDRLGWFKDLEQVVRGDGPAGAPDWDDVFAVADEWGAVDALVAQLERARRLLGPSIPDVRHLAPRPARAWAATVVAGDRLQPPERSNGARTVPVVLSWSTAPTPVGSVATMARMGGRWARRRRDPDATPPGIGGLGGLLGGATSSRPGGARRPVTPTPAQWRAYLATLPT